MNLEQQINKIYQSLVSYLDELSLRIWSAIEAQSIGRGGVSIVARATGISRTTIYAGLKDLQAEEKGILSDDKRRRVRSKGGGRKKLIEKDKDLLVDLDALVEPVSRGDPQSPLRWTCKSTPKLTKELKEQGHAVCQRTVCDLLSKLGYSLQSTRKTREGGTHPDRDMQFQHIATEVADYQNNGDPVISVDTKKKELIGDFKNGGQEWQPQGKPEEVRVYDFIDKELGKVAPYGVYDLTANQGWVSVGIDHDTAEFAVESIRRWWQEMGSLLYTKTKRLLITADCGGSNGYRVKLWRVQLQKLADELGVTIQVCHFPPGTSKWNKIEHRMFCHITQNWRGRPLLSRQVVVNLIGNTTTKAGLRIRAELDENRYQSGIKVTDDELATVVIERDKFHGEWNYQIKPHQLSDIH
ncbi:Rhodopirellula transposase DDE domain-containing protein [Nitrosomonas marina]|uniref:Rhodopirellula transposase DDE domain-containing protein n=1 Tax=Nitrosomonas marina TaxID=917 RepID=A0A1I0GK57_9PROT|nr:ISAzo13 family transposase [Nitrosomonas marina]SET71324.1 Rhodopirellula transposase DDE domain-containing protein [Nitrosomonas marina]